mmetsp:Transcript_12412/g.30986  ORF Transcript_12412/g.30986 Transcript_12412/m.30986 type:complete len:572 (+) Transcript_12412:146-1861(+)
MLGQIDKALAGAIDVVADDIQATMKSVREQGVKATLRDAVEDAGKLVVGGAGNVISGVIGGKRPEKGVSNHSGVSSGYADLCAPPGARFGNNIGPMQSSNNGGAAFPYNGGAAFPYVPQQSAGRSSQPGAAAGGGAKGGFAPGIGIQRAPAGGYTPGGGVQVFSKQPGAPQMGFHPFPGATPAPAPAPYAPAPYAPAPYAQAAHTPAPAPTSSGGYSGASYGPPPPATGKEPPVSPEELAVRIQAIQEREVGNQKCADCAAPNPDWASVSFGVLLCIECGGHHRQMGTHISRIRSCKMDSWTERQLQIFDHGGNSRFDEFCRANGISNAPRFQRYHTPAAEWYREAWIKNRIFSRPVPPPQQGVVVGPCKDTSAAAAKATAPAPQVDLLEFGGGSSAPAAKAAAQADLLGFGDAPATAKPAAAADADLLGVSSAASGSGGGGGGDLLGLGGGGGSSNSGAELLDFAAIAANARPPASALAGLDLTAASAPAPAPALAPGPAPAQLSAVAAAPQPLASLQMPAAPAASPSQPASTSAAPAMANTLGGGAKLIDPPKDEKSDPFAMALNKWGM